MKTVNRALVLLILAGAWLLVGIAAHAQLGDPAETPLEAWIASICWPVTAMIALFTAAIGAWGSHPEWQSRLFVAVVACGLCWGMFRLVTRP